MDVAGIARSIAQIQYDEALSCQPHPRRGGRYTRLPISHAALRTPHRLHRDTIRMITGTRHRGVALPGKGVRDEPVHRSAGEAGQNATRRDRVGRMSAPEQLAANLPRPTAAYCATIVPASHARRRGAIEFETRITRLPCAAPLLRHAASKGPRRPAQPAATVRHGQADGRGRKCEPRKPTNSSARSQSCESTRRPLARHDEGGWYRIGDALPVGSCPSRSGVIE